MAYRVIADHTRALTFAIADGIMPSNEGRGYVLRRILRRAARYGRQYLNISGPFIANLVPTVVSTMGQSYPEIAHRQKVVMDIIRSEEESFGKTLDRGIETWWDAAGGAIEKRKWEVERAKRTKDPSYSIECIEIAPGHAETISWEDKAEIDRLPASLDRMRSGQASEQEVEKVRQSVVRWYGHKPDSIVRIRQGSPTGPMVWESRLDNISKQDVERLCGTAPELSGADAFRLYATYGFPIDLTQLMAQERGLAVDVAGFEVEMAKHREISAGTGERFKADAIANLPPTDDCAKYSPTPIQAVVLGWVIEKTEEETKEGVSLEAVANSAVLSFDHLGGHPSISGPSTTPTPNDTAPQGRKVKKFISSGVLAEGSEAAVVLDRTNFYGEQGGQVGDSGVLTFEGGEFRVNNSVPAGQCVLHFGQVVKGRLKVGTVVTATVDESRIDTMRNHTATHLLNSALREVLGEHVNQAGSIVAPDRLRFDFSHGQAMTAEELVRVETMVNAQILRNLPVKTVVMPLAEGKKIPRVRAMFGEKYPDPVRVVMVQSGEPRTEVSGLAVTSDKKSEDRSLPVAARQEDRSLPVAARQEDRSLPVAARQEDRSLPVAARQEDRSLPVAARQDVLCAEFCGGTHLERTGQVGLFKIVAEESIAKGVRRITALTGKAAVEHVQHQDATLRSAALTLRCRPEELPERLAAMQKEIKELKKRSGTAAGPEALVVVATLETPAGKVLLAQTNTAEPEPLRTMCDVQRQHGYVAIMIGGVSEDKVTLVAMVDEALAKSGKLRAGDWVKAVAPVVDGGGGGKPTLAQAGGKLPQKLPDALQAAGQFVARETRLTRRIHHRGTENQPQPNNK